MNPPRRTTTTTRLLRQLENRFDKALIKYNEAQSIQKTYEQIVKRLSDERVTFDSSWARWTRRSSRRRRTSPSS